MPQLSYPTLVYYYLFGPKYIYILFIIEDLCILELSYMKCKEYGLHPSGMVTRDYDLEIISLIKLHQHTICNQNNYILWSLPIVVGVSHAID